MKIHRFSQCQSCKFSVNVKSQILLKCTLDRNRKEAGPLLANVINLSNRLELPKDALYAHSKCPTEWPRNAGKSGSPAPPWGYRTFVL